MWGAQVCVRPSHCAEDGYCLQMQWISSILLCGQLIATFQPWLCPWKDQVWVLDWSWTCCHCIVISIAPSGSASLVFATSRFWSPWSLSLATLLSYHSGNVIPKVSWDCIAHCTWTFLYNSDAIADHLFWLRWDRYCYTINKSLTLEGKRANICLL